MKLNFKIKILKNNKHRYLLPIFLLLFLIGFIGFAYITVDDNDWTMSSYLAKVHINYVWVRYYCKVFFVIGSYQVFDIVAILIMVLVESIFIKNKYSKKWVLYCIYAFVYFGLLITRIFSIVNAYYNGWGYLGINLDYEFLVPGKFEFISLLIMSFFGLLVVSTAFSYIRFYLSKKPYFMENEYWSKAISSLIYIFFIYAIVGFLKQSTGRPEYVFNDYENIYGKISKDSNGNTQLELSTLLKSLDFLSDRQLEEIKQKIIKQYDEGWLQPCKYFKWWEINGNYWDNIKFWYPINIFTNASANNAPPGWNVNNFPSGHTTGTFCLIGYGVTFIFHDNIKKIVKYCFSIVFVLYILNIITILMLAGTHWAGDVFFSLILGPSAFVLSGFISNKINKKIRNKYIDYDKKKIDQLSK